MVFISSDALQSTSAHRAGSSPEPPYSYGEQWARGETSKHCFPEQTRIGVELGFPRRLSLSQMQLREASLVPFLRGALGGSLPSWRRVGCWGQCTQGLFRPHPPSPQKRARLEVFSISSDHQQSTSAQGVGGSPDPPWPKGENRASGETTSAAFLSTHALGLSLVSRGEFHFRECSSQKLVLCRF